MHFDTPTQSRLADKQGWLKKFGLRAVGTCILLLVILVPSTGIASSQSEVNQPTGPWAWTTQVADGPIYFQNMTDHSMRFRADGVPCIAYGGDGLLFSCYNATTNLWTTELVDSAVRVGDYASLAFDKFSRPFISYYDGANGWLKLAYKIGGVWTRIVVDTPVMLDTTSTHPAEQELATEEELTPPVGLLIPEEPVSTEQAIPEGGPQPTDTPPAITEESSPNPLPQPVWRNPLLANITPNINPPVVGVGKYSSIAIDSNNRVHISYYDEQHSALKYAVWNGVTWDFKIVDDYNDQGDVGLWTSIGVDEDFNVHISYFSDKYDDLKYALRKGTGGWQKFTIDSAGNVGSYTSLALDKNGKPHISYVDFTDNKFKLKYATIVNGQWVGSKIDSSGSVGLYSSIAVGTGLDVNITYYDLSRGDLKYARKAGGSWTIKTLTSTGNVGLFTSVALFGSTRGVSFLDASTGELRFQFYDGSSWLERPVVNIYSDVGLSTSLALKSNGAPFISYLRDTDDVMKFAKTFGSTWITSVVIPNFHAGVYSSTKLAFDFIPHIAFYDWDEGDLMYAVWNGIRWEIQDVDTTYDTGQYVSLALEEKAFPPTIPVPIAIPHMSYMDGTNRDLIYATWDPLATEWVTETVDYIGHVGEYSSITLDPWNNIYISYYDAADDDLRMAYRSILGSWVYDIVDNPTPGDGTDVGWFTSIATDSLGNPHIAYYDATNGDLKLARWTGVNWAIETVDSAGDVGQFASLAINWVDNSRHICYYDATNANLKYAYWNGAVWSFDIVDSVGDVGMFCSIDLRGDGRPAISYYDATRGDLKFASTYALPLGEIFLPIILRN